jgi:DNA-binding NtrC family response regulator
VKWTFAKKGNTMTEYKSDLFFGALTGNGRVLVVDDEASVRTVVRMTLEKAGYDVLEAEDGDKAIEAINTGENRLVLDTVICDIRMPKINGVQAIDYFQREYPHVPLIVLTAYPNTDMAVSFMRHGVVDYLVKPVEADILRNAVAKAMDQRQVARV